jgi:hypothetical protein
LGDRPGTDRRDCLLIVCRGLDAFSPRPWAARCRSGFRRPEILHI